MNSSEDGRELLERSCNECDSCWQRYVLTEQIAAFAHNVASVDKKVATVFNHGIREDFTTIDSDDESHLSPETRTAIANAARQRHTWLTRAALSLDADALACSGDTDGSSCPLPSSIRRYERLIPPFALPYLSESDSAPVLRVEPLNADSDNPGCA